MVSSSAAVQFCKIHLALVKYTLLEERKALVDAGTKNAGGHSTLSWSIKCVLNVMQMRNNSGPCDK